MDVQLKVNEKGEGAFLLMDGEEKIGEMVIGLKKNVLTAYHTEVVPEAEGKGYSKKLLSAMVTYAREKDLKVNPVCPFVHLQFRRHPDKYSDIWLKDKSDR
jgi:uncharacterized protein